MHETTKAAWSISAAIACGLACSCSAPQSNPRRDGVTAPEPATVKPARLAPSSAPPEPAAAKLPFAPPPPVAPARAAGFVDDAVRAQVLHEIASTLEVHAVHGGILVAATEHVTIDAAVGDNSHRCPLRVTREVTGPPQRRPLSPPSYV